MAEISLEAFPRDAVATGRLPPDFLSEGLGLKPIVPAYLDPSFNISDFATGVCFASVATGYDNATSSILDVIPLWKEIEYYKEYQTKLKAYLGAEKAYKIITEALYTISLGTNDFIENYYTIPHRRFQFTVNEYQDFLIGIAENFFLQLYNLGARKISLTGLPPMGCLPAQRSINFEGHFDCNQEYNNVALGFNRKLQNMVIKLNKDLPGFKMVFANAYYIFLHLLKEPSDFGFEVTEEGCCGTGCSEDNPFTCTDASKFVFWDSIHPSEKANKIISNYLLTNYILKDLL